MRKGLLFYLVQHVAQFLVAVAPLSEVGSVTLTQRTYQRMAMLAADLAVFVSMSRVDGHYRTLEHTKVSLVSAGLA